MKRLILMLLPVAMAGCEMSPPPMLRPVSMELATKEGEWRLDGVQSATLELEDWKIRIVESGVSVASSVPMLEKLVLEVVNTSVDKPLVLEPDEQISIAGFPGEPVLLGPRERVALQYNQRLVLKYAPGLRAPVLPHPFLLRVTVFRGAKFEGPRTVTIRLY